ncbi:MAG: hypothetical protein ACUVT9_05350 [Candidatus Bathycorpusculaceae bacterium]
MERKFFSLLIIPFLIASQYAVFQFVPIVYASTVEEVYVNAFDGTYVAWTEVGSSPYLHDTDADYISRLTSKTTTYKEGNWSFPSSSGSGTINSVKLRFETKRTDLDGDSWAQVYVYDGASWISVGNIYFASTSYAWEEINVSSILNTWAKINAAKVYLITTKAIGITDTIYVRRCTRKVDYTVTGGAEERNFSFTEAIGLSATLTQLQEQHRTWTETIHPSASMNAWHEIVYTYIKAIRATETVNYWQEQFYNLTETTSFSVTLSHLKEMMVVIYEFVESVTIKDLLNTVSHVATTNYVWLVFVVMCIFGIPITLILWRLKR